MAAGERGLDRGLARAEPVERAIELGLVDGAEPEQPAQARTSGVGGKIARGGKLAGGEKGRYREAAFRQVALGPLSRGDDEGAGIPSVRVEL